MASSEAGRLLTEAYRGRQLALRAATVQDLLTVWPLFDLDDIDGSWSRIEVALLALIAQRRRASAGIASDYFRAFRTAEGAPGVATPLVAQPPNQRLLIATLRLLGPIATKKSIAAGNADPRGTAFSRIAGSVTRQVLNGGRQTLLASAKADRAAKGYRRITSANPCSFCAGIAAGGVVGLDVDFKAHDHCGCSQEVAY
jgi:hypothetical protein